MCIQLNRNQSNSTNVLASPSMTDSEGFVEYATTKLVMSACLEL